MRPRAPGIGDAVAIRCAADHRAAGDLAMMLRDQEVERRLDDRELQAEPLRDLRAFQLAGKMQRLEDELHHQVERQTGLRQRDRRRRMNDRWRGCRRPVVA